MPGDIKETISVEAGHVYLYTAKAQWENGHGYARWWIEEQDLTGGR